ncbi:MAG: hypothetical protein WCK28_00235 [Burkholderiales bacterium]|jgi:hypothetical protein
MAQVQEVGTGGTGATVTWRTVGRGSQIVTIRGERREDVQRAADKVYDEADDWLRGQSRPVAHPIPGGFSAVVYIDDAE